MKTTMILMHFRKFGVVWQTVFGAAVGLCLLSSFPYAALAQINGSLPVALTVPVVGASEAGGEVVIYDEQANTYRLTSTADAAQVFGVTTPLAPLVFVTASSAVSVVSSGAAEVQVDRSAGELLRGDLLRTSARPGYAAKASLEDEHVFAIALEASGAGDDLVLVQVDPSQAKSLLAERRRLAEEAEVAAALSTSGTSGGATEEHGLLRHLFDTYARHTLAVIVAIGSLFFIFYTFRSTIMSATLSVGRNPRARNAIMAVSFSNIFFAIIIGLLALFVAIGILVLPV